eukprot:TRINITY_DN13511_c0_g1_i1.p3 TRINITY_DN13511_c0_g1~~TRINITY_DN13511_c0_g1_i1.p3  ORF type:complete len:73 (+),score=10.08 TRINITY_DN13511_c0_g1_i1:221-439(+)
MTLLRLRVYRDAKSPEAFPNNKKGRQNVCGGGRLGRSNWKGDPCVAGISLSVSKADPQAKMKITISAELLKV